MSINYVLNESNSPIAPGKYTARVQSAGRADRPGRRTVPAGVVNGIGLGGARGAYSTLICIRWPQKAESGILTGI